MKMEGGGKGGLMTGLRDPRILIRSLSTFKFLSTSALVFLVLPSVVLLQPPGIGASLRSERFSVTRRQLDSFR